MGIVIRMLQKVLVNHFYSTNAGFFLFLFFILFGVPAQPVYFHYSLITGIILNQGFLLLVMLLWILYNLKSLDYTIRQILDPRQLFLFSLNSLPSNQRFLYLLYVQVAIYFPVLIYSLVIAAVAFRTRLLVTAEILFFDIALVAASAYLYKLVLQRTIPVSRRRSLPAVISITKPLFSIPLYFLWNSKKQMLLITKLFSLLFLYGFIVLYEPEQYDLRPLLLCLLVVAGAHSAVVFQVRCFEEESLIFTRNMPISLIKRFLGNAAMYTVLLLPEFIMLWKGLHLHFVLKDYPQLLLFTLAFLLLVHSVLLMDQFNMDQLIRTVFLIMAGLFFILMYNPGIGLALVLWGLSYIFFVSYYDDFEKKY